MEKIAQLKNLIEAALSKYSKFNFRYPPHVNTFTGAPIQSFKASDLKEMAEEYLIDFQKEFIEGLKTTDNERGYWGKEVRRVESLFELPSYTVDLRVITRDGKTQEVKEDKFYPHYYKFTEIEEDLSEGRIYSEGGPGCIAHLLATAHYYFWLIEKEPQTMNRNNNFEHSTPNKRLVWNGANNTLADIFYQLKQITNEDRKPMLDASNELIAEFLRANFECFKDTSISTIKEYFEKENKRPQKAINKITLTKGFPPKE